MNLITEIITPKTELEVWEHFKNRWQAQLIPQLSSAKKIRVYSEECHGCGSYTCREMGCWYDAEGEEL